MLKILLIGIATSNSSYSKCNIFKNKVIPGHVYPEGTYSFDDIDTVIGKIPCEVNQLYNSLEADQNQKNFEKSIYKNFADIRFMMDNSEFYDFKDDDIEIHTFKISNDAYSVITIKDSDTGSESFNQALNDTVLEISSDLKGDEYNFFKIDLTKTSITISYTPSLSGKINKIEDDDIEKPFTKTLLYGDIHEIKEAIELSPFSKYMSCKIKYFLKEKTVSPTLNEYIELPDEKDSYRINDINTIFATYEESFDIDYGETTYTINNKISKSDITDISVITTQRYYVTDENIIKLYTNDIIGKPKIIKGIEYVDNASNITSYIKLKPTAILGDEILIQYNKRVDIDTDNFIKISNVSNDRTSIQLTKSYDFEKNSFIIKYGKNIKNYKLINRGLKGKGKITDISNWNKKVDNIDQDVWTGFIWTEYIRPDFTKLVKDVKDGKSSISYAQLKEICIKYLNNLISSTEFQQIGLNESIQIDNLIVTEGYTDYSCRKINILSIREEDDTELSQDIVINDSIEVSFPPLFYYGDVFNNSTKIKIFYNVYGNTATGSFIPENGKDIYEMNDEDYFILLQEKFYENDIDEYILMNKINEVVLCGCYENTFMLKTSLDEDSGNNDRKENRQFTINVNDLVPNSAGAKNYPSKYYYKLVPTDLENEIIKTIKLISASDESVLKDIELINDTIYFKNYQVKTGQAELDITDEMLPMTLYIEYTMFVNKKIAYSSFIDQQYTLSAEEDKYLMQQSIPANFRLSFRPFTLTDGLIGTIGNLERKYTDFIRQNVILYNSYGLKKSNIIRYAFGNIMCEQSFFGETIQSFIDPGVFSLIVDYICVKLFKTKKSINWSTGFNDNIKIKYITDITETTFIDDFYMGGVEVFEARSVDEAVICVVNRTPNILNILKNPTYANYLKHILITIAETKNKHKYKVLSYNSNIETDIVTAIQNEYGSLIKDISVTVINQVEHLLELEVNITFVNVDGEVAIPIII